MDSDLPLIEMDEEDDDALIPLPYQTPSKSPLKYFSFSPLSTNSLKDMEKSSSSSVKASDNKENFNANNVQVPKLGMKPMPMKMRNKGAGYNLRKSLAWDRAFFTDEGILDPYELTLITGINDKSRGGELPAMSEEGNTTCSSTSRLRNKSNDTEDYEEVISKELRDKSCTFKGKREKTGSSMGKHDFLPHHKVTQTVLSVDCTNRVRFKVGNGSEPLAASSLKRPANSNILKIANKDSKLPKIPMSKPGSCVSATTKGSMTANQSRHTLIPRPTTSVQKDVGFKSSIKNLHGSQSKAKTGLGTRHLSAKELPKKPVRNLTNSSSKAASSTKSRLVQVGTTNSESEMVPDRSQLSEVQEESALATRNLTQDTATNSNNLITEAARLTSSGPCHNQRDSSGLILSDRLHLCESKEHPASLAASHHMNFYNTGLYAQSIEPARPSGLRLPSPSLRFFDQKTVSESGLLQQKINQQCNSNTSSNRKIGELRPPAVPARTPMKFTCIKENICSAPGTPNNPCDNSQLSLPPNYIANTTKKVPYSNIYPNLERKNEPRVDIMEQNECMDFKLDSHKVIGHEDRILGHEINMEMDKITCKADEEIKSSHPTEQLDEGNANLHLAGNVGYNRVGEGTCQLMSEGNDEKDPLAPETKEKSVLHIEEGRLQNHNHMSTSKEHILTRVDDRTNYMWDLAQTSREQSATKNSDTPNVNRESHLDAGRLEADEQANEVFVEFQKDVIRKRENDVGATKWVSLGLENYSVLQQHEKTWQENDVEVVDDHTLPIQDDARCDVDSSCSKTKGSNSITSRDPLKDEAQNGGNRDAIELKSSVSIINSSCIPFQNMNTVQGNDAADSFDVFPTNVGSPVLYDYLSAEGIHIDPSISIEHQSQLQDSSTGNRSAKCLKVSTPALLDSRFSSVNCSQEEDPCANATEITNDVIQETSCSNYSSAIFMEVPVEKQNGVDVALFLEISLAEVQLESGDVSPLIDDHNRSSLSRLRPEVELGSGTASVGDDALLLPESVLDVALSADTYPKILEKEGVDIADVITEAESRTNKEIQKSKELGINIVSLSDGDILVQSRNGLSSDLHNHSIHSDDSDVFGEHLEFSNAAIEMEEVFNSADSCSSPREVADNVLEVNRTLFDVVLDTTHVSTDNDRVLTKESLSPEKIADLDKLNNALDSFIAVPEESISHGCDLRHSNASSQIFPMVQVDVSDLNEDDLPNELQGFVGIRPLIETYDYFTNGQSGSCSQDPSESKAIFSVSQQATIATTLRSVTADLCSVAGGDESMLTSSCSAGEDEAETLQDEKSPVVGEFHHEFDSGSDLKRNKVSMPSIETYDYLTNGQSGSCAQDHSESNLVFSVSQQPTTGVETTSTTLRSVTAELCSVVQGDESMLISSYSIGEEDEAETVQEEKSRMVGELLHGFDAGSDVNKNKDATVSIKSSNNIKRQDNSLVIHPPNAVPFSDEWLAAIEAAGEEILTMKCGAVQHSPPDKSVPEPSPWSPVKNKAIPLGPYDCTKYTHGMPSNPH